MIFQAPSRWNWGGREGGRGGGGGGADSFFSNSMFGASTFCLWKAGGFGAFRHLAVPPAGNRADFSFPQAGVKVQDAVCTLRPETYEPEARGRQSLDYFETGVSHQTSTCFCSFSSSMFSFFG